MSTLKNIKNKICTQADLKSVLNVWRLLEKKIVFTNGCFDLLHLGHIDYLSKSADMGNKLVIGLNSDSSVSALKGPGRPISDQISRSVILASFSFVDAVVLFDEPTPIQLIELIRPDILVKGFVVNTKAKTKKIEKINNISAPWYYISIPAGDDEQLGWVFGGYFDDYIEKNADAYWDTLRKGLKLKN